MVGFNGSWFDAVVGWILNYSDLLDDVCAHLE
jgi:hypothetical protein